MVDGSMVTYGIPDGANKLHRTGDFESRVEGSRRAVVFYVDKGQFLSYLTWWVLPGTRWNIMEWNGRWLHSWHMIGLDSEAEAFDIILITHPVSVKKLPKVRMIDKQRPILETNRSALKYHRTLTLSQQDLGDAFGGSSALCQVPLSPASRPLRKGSQVRSLSQQPGVSLQPGCKFPPKVQVI